MEFADGSGELISYERSDTKQSKQSNYEIFSTDKSLKLKKVLEKSLDLIGIVKKTRYLYFFGQTRIHFDEVENLGSFIEFEYVLKPEENLENGKKIVEELMVLLLIEEKDLISHAYIDLLQTK